MKRKRFISILSLSFAIVFFVILSSSFFCLKNVSIVFYDENNNSVSFENNHFLNTTQKIDGLISSVDFEYGKSIFLIEKDKYINKIEFKNPYVKVLKIESSFPNKILICASERLPFYKIISNNLHMICDNQFKILSLETTDIFDCINVEIKSNQVVLDFFDFFDVQLSAFEVGQFLYEHNLILERLVLFYSCFFKKGFESEQILDMFYKIEIEEKENKININFLTTIQNYGLVLTIENALTNFETKIEKLLDAFLTLLEKEKIKTSYGILKIDDKNNCFWCVN